MISRINFIKPAARILWLALLGCALSTNVLADNYRVQVKRVASDSASGDVVLRIKPGTNENDFTGTARVMLLGSDPGINRSMATLLTAISLGTDILIDVVNPPSLNDIQVINSISLIAP